MMNYFYSSKALFIKTKTKPETPQQTKKPNPTNSHKSLEGYNNEMELYGHA